MHPGANTPSIQTNLVNTSKEGALVTNSLRIAEGVGNEHKHVIRLIRDNLADLEDFGRVRFQNSPLETAGGTQTRIIAVLNREHAMLLMTYMRNNEVVRTFKKSLIRAFVEMEKQLASPALASDRLIDTFQLPRNYGEALRELADTTERVEELTVENLALKGGDGIRIKDFIKTYFVAPNERAFFEWFYFHGYLIDGRIYDEDGKPARLKSGPKLRWDHMRPTYIGRKYFKLVPTGANKHGGKHSRIIPERAIDLVAVLMNAEDLATQMTQQGREALDEYRAPGQLRVIHGSAAS